LESAQRNVEMGERVRLRLYFCCSGWAGVGLAWCKGESGICKIRIAARDGREGGHRAGSGDSRSFLR